MVFVVVADLYEQQLNDVKVVPRKIFVREFARSYRPGQHVTFIGPSGRGKTKLAGELLIAVLHHISAIFVVILHGKIKDRDQTIIKLAKAAKLVITDHFPLTRTEKLRHRDARGVVLRPLNKPGNSVREENNLLARSFKRAIHLCYHAKASKPVILFLDESHQTQVDLKLKEDCEGPLMRGRPVCGEWNLIQRGRYVSYMCYDQAEWVFIFYDPDKPNQERYSEIGGVDKYLLIELTKRLEKRTAPDGSTYSQCIAFRRSGDMLCIVDFLCCVLPNPNVYTPLIRRYTIGAFKLPATMQRRPQRMETKGASGRKRSFLIGTQDVWEGGDYDQTFTNTAGGALPPWTLQATGWLSRLWFYVTYTTTGGTALTADAPFILFNTIQLNDVNNEAIFGPFDGYSWYVANKLGGYFFDDDPGTNSAYAASATAGTFIVQIPLEIVSRDPIGAVASVNNTATLTVLMTVNSATTAFTGATAWSVRVRGTQEFYWEPRKTDKQGREISGAPPANGTTQYWTQGSVPIAAAGVINQQLITGLGYPFRMYNWIYRDSTGSRANGEANWPDPMIGLKFEANFLLTQLNKALWQSEITRATQYNNSTMDVRGAGGIPGKENGVYTWFFNRDFFRKANGGETRRTYLVTSPGSNMIINGNFGVAGNLYELVNYVAPGGGGGAGNAQSRHQDTAMITGGM